MTFESKYFSFNKFDIARAIAFVILYFSTTFLLDFKWGAIGVVFPVIQWVENKFSIAKTLRSYGNYKIQIALLIFTIFAAINATFNAGVLDNSTALLFFMMLYPVNFCIAHSFKKEAFRLLFLFLVGLEILVGIAELSYGVSTFEWASNSFRYLEWNRLLYHLRVNGLSVSSSIFAAKVFLSLLLIFSFRSKLLKRISISLVLIGLLITFNRTIILAILFLFFIVLVNDIRILYQKSKLVKVLKYRHLLIVSAIFLLVFPELEYQLTRGNPVVFSFVYQSEDTNKHGDSALGDNGQTLSQNEIDKKSSEKWEKAQRKAFSGRIRIWKGFYQRFRENPFFGNGSIKYKVDEYHAHNSYLQVLVSHGLIISLILFTMIFMAMNSINFFAVSAMLIIGCFQYFFFWNISLADIFLFVFLGNFISIRPRLLQVAKDTT